MKAALGQAGGEENAVARPKVWRERKNVATGPAKLGPGPPGPLPVGMADATASLP